MKVLYTSQIGIPTVSTSQEDWNEEELKELPIALILDSKGLVLWKTTSLTQSRVHLSEEKAKSLGLVALEDEIEFRAAKLPAELIQQVVAFFREVYSRQKSEAAGLLVYNENSARWDFVVPVQTATGGHAKYIGDREDLKKWLDKGYQLAGTIHSHGSMSAFHSGTDVGDEEGMDGLHITIGKVDSTWGSPEFACSVVADGVRAKFEPSDVIEGLFDSAKAPKNWLDAVKRHQAPAKAMGKDPEVRYERLWDEYISGQIDDGYFEATLKAWEEQDREAEKRNGQNYQQVVINGGNSNGNFNSTGREINSIDFKAPKKRGFFDKRRFLP